VYYSSKNSIVSRLMADWYKRLPNWLTFLRLFLIPIFVIVLLEPSRSKLNLAAIIFVCAAITDYADGILARRYAAVTDFGKLFDPLADKILVMAALVMLVALRDDRCISFVPGWMVVLILARELWITGLRAFAAKDGTIVAAKAGGKVKSFLQMVSILALLLHDYSFPLFGLRITFQFVGLNLLLVSVVFSYLSALDYSLAILAPEQGSLGELTRRLSSALIGSVGSDSAPSSSGPEADAKRPEEQRKHVSDEESLD
jgi:CDP-diacylglycerol--glycerol-3-phosphate 3-phosphatidyltransferase